MPKIKLAQSLTFGWSLHNLNDHCRVDVSRKIDLDFVPNTGTVFYDGYGRSYVAERIRCCIGDGSITVELQPLQVNEPTHRDITVAEYRNAGWTVDAQYTYVPIRRVGA